MIEVKDRIPTYKNRFSCAFEDESLGTHQIVLEKADNPIVVGTEINKAIFDSINEDLATKCPQKHSGSQYGLATTSQFGHTLLNAVFPPVDISDRAVTHSVGNKLVSDYNSNKSDIFSVSTVQVTHENRAETIPSGSGVIRRILYGTINVPDTHISTGIFYITTSQVSSDNNLNKFRPIVTNVPVGSSNIGSYGNLSIAVGWESLFASLSEPLDVNFGDAQITVSLLTVKRGFLKYD